MTDEQDEGPKTLSASDPGLKQFILDFALVFTNCGVYGTAHSVTAVSIAKCFDSLTTLLEGREQVNFALSEGDFIIDGIPDSNPTPAVKTVIERLSHLEVGSFSLANGLTEDEFGNLIELLHSDAEEMRTAGGFAKVVHALEMEHVIAKKVIIQQITEDEMVVNKDKLGQVLGTADMDKIVSILRGEISAEDPEGAAVLKAAASDSHRLAGIVIEAANVENVDNADELVDNIVGSVETFYEQISKTDQTSTQKGRKSLLKTLGGLETELVDDVMDGNMDPSAVEAAVDKIRDSIETLKEDLQIDSLTAEYAKKRNAIEASETRILKFLTKKGEDALADGGLLARLRDSGLTEDAWAELMTKADVDDSDQFGEDAEDEAAVAARRAEAMRAAQALASSLGKLEAVVGEVMTGVRGTEGGEGGLPGATPADEHEAAEVVETALTDVAEHVEEMAGQTEKKIDQFIEEVKKPSRKNKGKRSGLTKQAIIDFLAEIVQELRQPLAVVTSTVSALRDGLLGEVSEPQKEMLGLAATSADRLDNLTDKLLDISGLPDYLNPDSEILGTMYDGDIPSQPDQVD